MNKASKKSLLKNPTQTTELVFIIDRSGSMYGLEKDTIGGFNAMIQKQKNLSVNALVSTILFDDEVTTLHDRLPLATISPLTDKEYTPRGTTALLDAIGSTIQHISNIHKYIRPNDVPQKTIFVITTDGHENDSKTYQLNQVKQMIQTQQNLHHWEFLFLGANIDAIETAKNIGIEESHAANIINDSQGVDIMYQTMGEAIKCCCTNASLPKNWKEKINQDYTQRHNKKS